MKKILAVMATLILSAQLFGQFTDRPGKIQLGYQTTANGLVCLVNSIPSFTPSDENDCYVAQDTVNNKLYIFKPALAVWSELSGGGGGATDLNQLDDVTLTTPVTDQVLKYDGTKWINATLPAGAADGVSTSGVYDGVNEEIDITVASPGTSFSIDVSALLDNTDNQTLSLAGTTLSIEDGNSVDLSGLGGSGTDDQTISLVGNTLSIEDGNSVDLSGYLDNTDAQDLSLSGNTLSLSGDATSVDLSGYLDNTDAQDIEVFTLTGTILQIAIENGGGTYTQNLASLQDGTGTDDQTAAEVPVTAVGNLTSTDVQAALQELQTDIDAITGGAGDGVITGARYDAVDEEIDVTVAAPGTSFSFDVSALTKLTESEVDAFVANNGYLTSYTETDPVYSAAPAAGITSLNITNWNTAYGWGDHSAQGYLTSEVDGSVTNEIQDLSLTGTTLSLTGDATTVDLSVIQDGTGTDDQTAAEVAVTPVGNLNSTDVQAALQEHQADIDAISAGAGDGVATAGAYNAGTGNIDITVAAPGSSFSFDVSALEPLTEGEVDAFVANNGYLTAEVDGSITNEIQDLSLTGNTLSLTDDATTVDLSGYLDNTDDQTIDVFAFDGTNLTLSLEGDGEATKSIDLSSLSTNTTYDFIQLNTAFVNTDFAVGEIGWSENDEVRIGILNNYDFAVGQDMYKTVHNTTGSQIDAGTAVMMTGADGNSSVFTIAPMNYPTIGAEYLIGVTAVDIAAGGTGVAVQNGNVRGLDIDAAGWSAGDVLYLDEVSAGGLTTTPGDVLVAAVTSAGTNGSIYVRPDFYAGLSQAEADAVGAMVSGNTETLIDVSYQADNTIDFVVNDDLSLYDNTTSGFLTSEVDGSVTNEVNTGMAWTDATNTVSVTDANGTVSAIITGFQETLTGSETVFDGWDKDASNDLVDSDFGTAGLMATDGAGTYSIITDNSTNWNTAYSWGDHAAINNTTAGNVPYWDGDSWENTAVSYSGIGGVTVGTLLNLSTVNTAATIDGVLTLEGGVVTQTSVASLQDGTGTDDQALTYNVSSYLLSLEDGGNVSLAGLAQTIGVVDEFLAISGVTSNYSVPIINTVESATSGTLSVAVDLESSYNRVVQLNMISANSVVALSVSNPVSGGVYTFHFQQVAGKAVDFPGTFMDAAGNVLDGGTSISFTENNWYTCYYDGLLYHCK